MLVPEDKLQDNVQDTIVGIRRAGIRLWVLTGYCALACIPSASEETEEHTPLLAPILGV